MYYFAYGSNLDARQMRARCPGARYAMIGTLPHYTLSFRGYSPRWQGSVATVTPWRGASTQGLLYTIDERDLRALDSFEGHPFAYERRRKLIVTPSGRRVFAQIYIKTASRFDSPGPEYLRVILRAYKRYGFDSRPLHVAAWGLS